MASSETIPDLDKILVINEELWRFLWSEVSKRFDATCLVALKHKLPLYWLHVVFFCTRQSVSCCIIINAWWRNTNALMWQSEPPAWKRQAALLHPEMLINSRAAGRKLLSFPGIYFQRVSAAAACRNASLCAPRTICDYSTFTSSTAA